MGKQKSVAALSRVVEKHKKQGKQIGLITGCFDVIHIGHIEFFQKAKKHVDVLVVGVDNDKNISTAKGKDKPIFCLNDRLRLLVEIGSVDFVFPIKEIFEFNSEMAHQKLLEITKTIKPNYLITNTKSDKYWREKELRARQVGARLIKIDQKPKSSSAIIERLQKEF